MINKLWREELDKDDMWILKTIQSYIDLYCPDSVQFKVVEDITPNNCADYWRIVLQQYKYYNVTLENLSDLSYALQCYFTNAYELEFAKYPVYPKNDRRNLAMYIDSYLQVGNSQKVLPEDTSKLIEYLDTPNGNVEEARKRLDKYLNQFDGAARAVEYCRRFKAITKDRLEAIEKRYPMPIKPMSIELDTVCAYSEEATRKMREEGVGW